MRPLQLLKWIPIIGAILVLFVSFKTARPSLIDRQSAFWFGLHSATFVVLIIADILLLVLIETKRLP